MVSLAFGDLDGKPIVVSGGDRRCALGFRWARLFQVGEPLLQQSLWIGVSRSGGSRAGARSSL